MKGNDHARSVRKERGSGLKGEKPWAKAKGALLVVLLSSFVLVPLFALAQPPAGAPAARMQYTNRQQFRLKIDLGDTDRQKLREVQLYVKSGNEPWACKETAPPTQTHFGFKAPQDGEYWFTIVTVDKGGKATPADVTKEAPAFIVVVDTQAPDVTVTVPPPAARAHGDDVIRCTVRDASPDPNGLKLEYQLPDKSWRLCEPVAGSPDALRCPDTAAWTGQLRVTATDLAKNTTTREVSGVAPTTTAAAAGMSPTPSAPPVPAISTAPPPPVPVDVASGHTDNRVEKVAAPAQGPDLVSPERP